MANRIDSVQNGITPKPTKGTSESGSGGNVRSSGDTTSVKAVVPGPKDTVVLTEQGQRLEALEKAAAAVPTVDRARVDAVKADIASGNYQVDVENIADILLSTEAQFDE